MTTALPRYTGHVVGGLLDASPQPGSRARRDNGCTLRTHFRTSLYTGGEGRRERRRFTKNDNAIVPCLLVIGPSMPPPLRSRMNFQGNRLEGGLVVCTLNRLGVHVHLRTRCCFGYVAARTNTGKLWACVGQLARARIIDLVNGNGVTCIGFLMRPG